MSESASERSHRKGLTLMDIMEKFLNEETATKWFESSFRANGCRCPCSASLYTYKTKGNTITYRYRKFGKRFSERTGTLLQSSRLHFSRGYRQSTLN